MLAASEVHPPLAANTCVRAMVPKVEHSSWTRKREKSCAEEWKAPPGTKKRRSMGGVRAGWRRTDGHAREVRLAPEGPLVVAALRLHDDLPPRASNGQGSDCDSKTLGYAGVPVHEKHIAP